MAMARKSVLSAKDAAVNPPVAIVLRYTRAGSELPHQTAEAALCRSFFVIIIEWWSLPLKHLDNVVENITCTYLEPMYLPP